MGKNRRLKRPLSWFLAKLGLRGARAAEALRLARSEPNPPAPGSAALKDGEDLLWTCR